MNNKILIEIYIPVLDCTYEFWAPLNYNIACITKLLVDYLKKQQASIYMPDENAVLCDLKTGKILNYNMDLMRFAELNELKFLLI